MNSSASPELTRDINVGPLGHKEKTGERRQDR